MRGTSIRNAPVYSTELCQLSNQLALKFPVAKLIESGFPVKRRQFVAIDDGTGQIVGTVTLLVEKKIIHKGASVGYLEDMVVDARRRGNGIGRRLCQHACQQATSEGCYKVVLNCSAGNRGFYESCGFRQHNVSMRFDCTGGTTTPGE